MKISRCGIHGFHETLRIDQDEIRFCWTLESDDELAAQTAHRNVVREAEVGGIAELVLWDSGRCDGSTQRDIVCKPQNGFRSTFAYWWQVSVWDHKGREWKGSDNTFFTAYLRSQLLPPLSMNQVSTSRSKLFPLRKVRKYALRISQTK